MTETLNSVCTFSVLREVAGTNGSTNYETISTLPPMYVEKISMKNTLNKQITFVPPADGKEQNPEIVILGIKGKTIDFSGTFPGYAYSIGQSPPIQLIPKSGILKLKSDPDCICPEFDDSTGYWRIKSVSWNVDSKSMLWKADIQTSFIWTDPLETMFFE